MKLRLGWGGAAAGLAVLLVGWMYAGHRAPGRVDRWFVDPTADAVEGAARRVALTVDFLAEPLGAVILVSVIVVVCVAVRALAAAVFVCGTVGVTLGVVLLLKSVVGRTIHGEGNLSYPSGHTAFLTALTLSVTLVLTARRGLGRAAGTWVVTWTVYGAALVAGGAMGWAQVALGAHYPTDALGGWCTAVAVVPVVAWLVKRGMRGAGLTSDGGRRV
ncbi:phosphatase PAP2 family protein [Streptomyces sp. NPDC050418]|uniref:phosphatase PAP2 family protein n=1 Tax=Streptomyces sp. NPDC050418 TaxID=3365612 RepID=UPI00379AEF20